MKPTLSLLAVPLLFTACQPAGPSTASATNTGRYQIITGTYQDQFFHSSQPIVIKVDTTTGETWTYESGMVTPPGGPGTLAVYGWRAVDSISNRIANAYKVVESARAGEPPK